MRTWTFDLLGLVGLALLTAGCYLIALPLALIVPGVGFIALAIVGAKRHGAAE